MDLSIIIHTTDKYSWVWEPWYYYFSKCWNWEIPAKVYFCNELINVEFENLPIEQLKSGSGEWSNRLKIILQKIPTRYVFYMQEDFWPSARLEKTFIRSILDVMERHQIMRFGLYQKTKQINTIRSSTLINNKAVEIFTRDSNYLISHHPGIWDREFFLRCLLPNESPWKNELSGTKRIQSMDIMPRICMIHLDWYNHTVKKGHPKPVWYELKRADQW